MIGINEKIVALNEAYLNKQNELENVAYFSYNIERIKKFKFYLF